jgi:hypothetical protein
MQQKFPKNLPPRPLRTPIPDRNDITNATLETSHKRGAICLPPMRRHLSTPNAPPPHQPQRGAGTPEPDRPPVPQKPQRGITSPPPQRAATSPAPTGRRNPSPGPSAAKPGEPDRPPVPKKPQRGDASPPPNAPPPHQPQRGDGNTRLPAKKMLYLQIRRCNRGRRLYCAAVPATTKDTQRPPSRVWVFGPVGLFGSTFECSAGR